MSLTPVSSQFQWYIVSCISGQCNWQHFRVSATYIQFMNLEVYDTTKMALCKPLATSKLKQLFYGFQVPKDYVASQHHMNQPMAVKQAQAKFHLHGRIMDNVHNDKAIHEMWNSTLSSRLAQGLPHYFDMCPRVLFPLFPTHTKLQLAIAPAPGNGNNKICLMGVNGKLHLSE
ncbi:uncharacterized protein LACBIDRAFT_322464 [Laccaria bicolor S238N-H82]|uniref:Predicted protein n=1 Tax=Laccaria bicolor (strain S238N-H82 / ATCC MYA-4686) TaxID=486041 RepID=B0CWD7_LACBS|nr:uncharacterized protein LACBIDRAFT_322464 [Laccaria bicolor S238N-H82]EDR13049.1 predicted protein [Laccaria bicolor S238N-H82]|eukprot:XP_001875547.1 predicted protein [Laccaria bicolor S238N-H82]